ncbi:PAS domain S-box protein [Neorhizobium sp. P12A]|uniref:sensor histidine kinase n=1 Tax=Neorhizobium sp. P12A TaxID=2268027 RepID=UPI0011ED0575|nr:HWE histidine kinase domain-containing protein [Neorhizobium sp. P12A]KAA0687403.1 PAS domain S-box protein [Neorhizobium sp. P12A]
MKIEIGTDKVSARARFLEAIVESAIDYAIISMDLDGLVTSWSAGAHQILGWAPDDMIGNPATVFFTEEDRENGVPQSEMTAALNKGRGSDERWHVRADGSRFWASGEMMALTGDNDRVIGFVKILRDRTEQREQADRQRLLMHELGHRMKNTLSVIQSIITQSIRNAASLDDASKKLQSRITAYSKAHDILLQKDWVSATLANIVGAATATIGMEGTDRIRSNGPDVKLGPQAALSFAMVFHELLTNACKYGALSGHDGHAEIEWRVDRRDREVFLLLSWREIGGPVASEPTRHGFGSRLIESSLQAYGEVKVSYKPEGLVLTAEMPLPKLQYRNELAEIDG